MSKVQQSDRANAAAWYFSEFGYRQAYSDLSAGKYDGNSLVQAFATAREQTVAETERAIVGYLREQARRIKNGDFAAAKVPAGLIEVIQDGLAKALDTRATAIERGDYRSQADV